MTLVLKFSNMFSVCVVSRSRLPAGSSSVGRRERSAGCCDIDGPQGERTDNSEKISIFKHLYQVEEYILFEEKIHNQEFIV